LVRCRLLPATPSRDNSARPLRRRSDASPRSPRDMSLMRAGERADTARAGGRAMDGGHAQAAARGARPPRRSGLQVAAAAVASAPELDAPSDRWTVGVHGAFELDSAFCGLTLSDTTRRGEQRIASRGRLWSGDGMAVSSVELTIECGIAVLTEI